MLVLRIIGPLLGLAVIAATVLIGQELPATSPAPPAPVTGATSATRVCPSVTGGGGGSVVVDSMAAPADSAVQLQRGDGTELGTVPGGQLRTIAVEEATTTVARATGGAATQSGQSSIAEQTEGPKQGLLVSPCTAATTEAWFAGLGANDQTRGVLLITNPDSEAAEVSLNIFTSDGLSSVAGTSGIAIQPGETRDIALEALLSSDDPLVVQVEATSGRVSAVAEVETGSGEEPAGADWAASASIPETTVIVPGVPGDEGSRELVVVNPGTERTEVRVELLGKDGPFAPVDADRLDLAAESVGSVQLEGAAGGEPLAVRVTSEQPVTAGVISRSSNDSDVAYAPAAAPIGAFGVAAVAGWQAQPGTLVVSSATETDTTFDWKAFGEDGSVVGEGNESVPASGSTAVELPDEGRISVHVTPAEGAELYAGVSIAGDADDLRTLATAPVIAGRVVTEDPPDFDDGVGRQ